eukprot:135329-Alexandrium_andersonii.AAC.1
MDAAVAAGVPPGCEAPGAPGQCRRRRTFRRAGLCGPGTPLFLGALVHLTIGGIERVGLECCHEVR